MVRTPGARSKIRRFLKKVDFEQNRHLGKETLERQLKKMHLDFPNLKDLLECAESFSYKNLDTFLAAIGTGDVSPVSAVNRIYPQTMEDERDSVEDIISGQYKPKGGVKIDDIKSLQFNFGKCCQPVPGEDVVGFITRGRGITVHRHDCVNVNREDIDPERVVELEWDVSERSSFIVRINLIMEDRKNILRDILNSIADDETNLKNSHITASKGLAKGEFIAEVRNLSHLNQLLDRIKQVKGVIDVSRYMGSSGSKK